VARAGVTSRVEQRRVPGVADERLPLIPKDVLGVGAELLPGICRMGFLGASVNLPPVGVVAPLGNPNVVRGFALTVKPCQELTNAPMVARGLIGWRAALDGFAAGRVVVVMNRP